MQKKLFLYSLFLLTLVDDTNHTLNTISFYLIEMFLIYNTTTFRHFVLVTHYNTHFLLFDYQKLHQISERNQLHIKIIKLSKSHLRCERSKQMKTSCKQGDRMIICVACMYDNEINKLI